MTDLILRHGEAQDLAAIVEIYNFYVTQTPVTFDVDPFDVEDRQDWFAQFAPDSRHQIHVVQKDNDILGYATSQPLKPKQAYETSVETSIYLKQGTQGQGLGHKLYSTLLTALEQVDVHRAYGLVVVPNEASVALHIKHGFRPCSTFKEIGRKFGRFHDVQWFERPVPGNTN